MGHFCKKCGLVMNDDQFYTSKNKEKYPPDGKLDMCKKCMTMHVDNWDPSTYLWILEEIDIPYVKDEWNKVLAKSLETSRVVTGTSVVGKYISRMKIKQWSSYTWADSDRLNEEQKQKKIRSMKAQGFTQDEIETEVNKDKTPAKPKTLANNSTQKQEEKEDILEEQGIDFDSQLTQEDKMRLRLKWGKGYTAEQWIKLEQLYTDFENSYDIQTAGHKDTLIMVCKASLKANQLFDMDDIENAQRMTRVYNDLMKSGNFQAVQNKTDNGEFIDSVGELVSICEKEGFIPRYYVDSPKDKVDQTLLDLQHYTRTLVTEELNLGNMIENALLNIQKDKEKESVIDIGDETDDEVQVDDYRENIEITPEDEAELRELESKEKEIDQQNMREEQNDDGIE